MSNLFYAIAFIFFIGFAPLFYTVLRSLKQANLKNKQFYQLVLKDLIRTVPVCCFMLVPIFIAPESLKWYLLLIHIIFTPLLFLELAHIYLFKTRIGLNTFFSLFVTNMTETKEYLKQNISPIVYILAFLFMIMPVILILNIAGGGISVNLSVRLAVTVILLTGSFPFFRNLFKTGFKFKDGYILNPYSNVFYHFYLYKKQYKALKKVLSEHQTTPFKDIASSLASDEAQTYVVIIGESANRNHLSLYGYNRQTTPFSESVKDDLLIFKKVTSPFAQTLPVLERVLTFMDKDHLDFLTKKGTIIDYFKQAGFKTYWFSNQYALADTLITAVSSQADWEKSYNFSGMKRFEKTGFDGDMLPDIERILNQKDVKKKVLFIHLIGSHSAYANRYPADWVFFKDSLENKNLSSEGHKMLNAYDDSIRYTDFVVNEIIKKVQAQDDTAFTLYFSDHGEDIYDSTDKRILGHNELANDPMTQVPFILWLSEKYQKKFPRVVEALKNNLNKSYNTENVIHTILSLAGLSNEDIILSDSLTNNFDD